MIRDDDARGRCRAEVARLASTVKSSARGLNYGDATEAPSSGSGVQSPRPAKKCPCEHARHPPLRARMVAAVTGFPARRFSRPHRGPAPSRRWRSGTLARAARTRPAGMPSAGTLRKAFAMRTKSPVRTTPPGLADNLWTGAPGRGSASPSRTAEAGTRRKASRAAARLTSRPSGTGVVEAHTSVPRSSEPVGDHGQVPLERHSGRPRPICALISARQCHSRLFAVHFRVRVLPLIRRQGTSSESTVPRAESCSRAGNDAIGGS